MITVVEESSERWKKLLEVTGAKRNELAKIAGVDRSNITKYCSGEYKAKQDVIFKVCEHYGIRPEWLMGLDVPMKKEMVPVLPITGEESHMIALYRKASPAEQEMIMSFLRKYE